MMIHMEHIVCTLNVRAVKLLKVEIDWPWLYEDLNLM